MKNNKREDIEEFKKLALSVVDKAKKHVKNRKEISPDDWDKDYNQIDKDLNEVIKLVKKF